MSRYLLDTNVGLWLVDDPGRIRPEVMAALRVGGELTISAASLWEAAIKASLGKLKVREDWPSRLTEQGVVIVPVAQDVAWAVRSLPPVHKDPFDRLIVAQGLHDGSTLVTSDAVLKRYGVELLET